MEYIITTNNGLFLSTADSEKEALDWAKKVSEVMPNCEIKILKTSPMALVNFNKKTGVSEVNIFQEET